MFEWDESKAATNLRKHGIAFDEAKTVFLDRFALTAYDEKHSDDEDRYVIMGVSNRFRLLMVSFTERGHEIRLISARIASTKERKDYENGQIF